MLCVFGLGLGGLIQGPAQASAGPVALSSLDAGAGFSRLAIWSGRAHDYAGKAWDTSLFYRPDRPSHYLRLGLLFGLRPDLLINAGFYVDTGLRSPAMKVAPYGGLSLTLIALPRDNMTVSFGISDLLSIGGAVRERPCRDLFDRAFHCGTALPWTDYLTVAPDYRTARQVFGRVQFRF